MFSRQSNPLNSSSCAYSEDQLRASFESGYPPASARKAASLDSLGVTLECGSSDSEEGCNACWFPVCIETGACQCGTRGRRGAATPPPLLDANGDEQLIVSIEGNIGSGKTTLLEVLKESLGKAVEIVPEPVHIWKNVNGVNLLGAFYGNPSKYGATFQSLAFVSRLVQQQTTPRVAPIRILERSCLTDRLFARQCLADGNMDKFEIAAYTYTADFYTKATPGVPHACIILNTAPALCYARMKERARSEESLVPKSYLEAIHAQHERFCEETTLPIFVVDATPDFRRPGPARDKIVADIVAFTAEQIEARSKARG